MNTQTFFLELSLGKSAYLQVKKHILVLFNQLINSKIIYSDFTVTYKNGKVKTVQTLTTNIISRSKCIDFYDAETNRVASFRKDNGKFISFWKMDKPGQIDEFLNNNNVI